MDVPKNKTTVSHINIEFDKCRESWMEEIVKDMHMISIASLALAQPHCKMK